MLTLTRDISFQFLQVLCSHHQPQLSEWKGHRDDATIIMWKMSICCNTRWRKMDRQAANLCNAFWEARPSPDGTVIYLFCLQCLERWGEERWHRHSLPEGLAHSWGIANIIGLLSLAVLAPIRHFFLLRPPTWLQTALRSRGSAGLHPLSRDSPNKTCHLCLWWHLFDRERFFFPSSFQLIPTMLSPSLFLAQAIMLEIWM